jgi:hypothetical protein
VRERFVGGKAGESSCLLPSIFFLSPEKGANLVSHLNAGEWRACDSACSSDRHSEHIICSANPLRLLRDCGQGLLPEAQHSDGLPYTNNAADGKFV